jgi:hypothetical protein
MNIKEKIIANIAARLDSQNAKGLAHYGKRLEDCDLGDYDWNIMINEELIDALQYQQMELKKVKKMLFIAEKENRLLKMEGLRK